VNQYVDWCSTASAETFFTDEGCREIFKRNALNVLSRTNAFNGLRYRDDPTIFSWVRPQTAYVWARLRAACTPDAVPVDLT